MDYFLEDFLLLHKCICGNYPAFSVSKQTNHWSMAVAIIKAKHGMLHAAT
jgi:hypothetical protein